MNHINKKILDRVKSEISEDEIFIMGRPNFTLAGIANRLRTMGVDIPFKSESEQAVSIYTMLQFHKEYGDTWRNELNTFLKEGLTTEP